MSAYAIEIEESGKDGKRVRGYKFWGQIEGCVYVRFVIFALTLGCVGVE